MQKKSYPKRRTFSVRSKLEGKLGVECAEKLVARLEALAGKIV